MKKVLDFVLTTFTVAAGGLLISMLFGQLIHYDIGGLGYFNLDGYQVAYHWPSGKNAINEEIWWIAPGLIASALLLLLPVVLHIMSKKALIFFWLNVVIIGSIIGIQQWGVTHSLERIETVTHHTAVMEFYPSFYFPYYALGFVSVAALLYTFFGSKLKTQEA